MSTELKERFSRKQWKGCCGRGCKKCEIAQAYIGEHGRKKGLELLNEGREAATKGKAKKKGGAGVKKNGGAGAKKKGDAGAKKAARKGGKGKKG